jgi:hypothetical protein
MELMYGKVVLFGIIILAVFTIALFYTKKRAAGKFVTGIRAANTKRIRESLVYKKLESKYRTLRVILIVGIIGSIVSSLFLIARPYRTDDVYSGVKKRDIILCLDVSYSLYDLNYEITDYLKEVVKGLEGDRIGINIFNTSTVTYVPLTDDYEYCLQKLDELSEYFALQKEYQEKFGEYTYIPDDLYDEYKELAFKLDYYDAGTLYNNRSKGSSLVGEGLGTALYSFPYLGESDRTRVIIMCTDNELNAFKSQIMELDEAAEACAQNNVTIFGIFPREEVFYNPEEYDYDSCKKEFQDAVESTGGKFYVRTENQAVSEIVQDIQKQEAMLVKVVMSRQTVDLPGLPFIILLICLALGMSAGLVLQK